MDNLKDYIASISESELSNFINLTKSDILVKKDIEKVTSDTSWIDMVEESIPYLDNIIRNPRHFIVQEENIVPIEKAKVVTEESIRHLAQHTSLIQDVKEDGSIVPLKLLNVYREETVDLYENRFIKSLVDNLYTFVENKLKESDQRSFAKINSQVTYNGEHKTKKETIKISLNLESSFEDEVDTSKDGHSLETRIEHIRDVIGAFKGSTFIKSLKDCAVVRSPIRKTNVILKEQNFVKALELWEFLEKNLIKPITVTEKKSEETKDINIKNKYDLSFFIDTDALKETKTDVKTNYNANIGKMVNDFVFNSNVSETEFKKMLNKEFKEATRKKKKIVNDIEKKFKTFVSDFEKNKKRAMSFLK